MAVIDNLVAFYSLEDNAANSTIDDAHNVGPYDGVVVNDQNNFSSEQSVAAKVSLGFELDGTNDYGTVTGAGITTLITLQAWVQPDVNNVEQTLVYVGDGTISGGGADHHRLGIDSNGKAFIETQRGSTGARATGSTTLLTDGTWYHLIGVCRATNDREIYVNNSSDGTNAGSEVLVGTATVWSIGAWSDGTAPYDGIIDEVGVWSVGKSTADISSLYNSGSGLAYPFAAGSVSSSLSASISASPSVSASLSSSLSASISASPSVSASISSSPSASISASPSISASISSSPSASISASPSVSASASSTPSSSLSASPSASISASPSISASASSTPSASISASPSVSASASSTISPSISASLSPSISASPSVSASISSTPSSSPSASVSSTPSASISASPSASPSTIATTNIAIVSDNNDIEPNHATDNSKSELIKDGLEVQGDIWAGGATNYSHLDSNGNHNLFGNANVIFQKASGNGIKIDPAAPDYGWNDLKGEILPKELGAGKPTWVTFRGNIKGWAFDANDVVDLIFHFEHDYVLGRDIHIHAHWTHDGTAISGSMVLSYRWTYAKGHNQSGVTYPAETTFTQTVSTPNVATYAQYSHPISEIQFSAQSPSAGQIDTDILEPDGILKMSLTPTTIPTVTGGSFFIDFVDIHYQSTGIGTKQKAPNFYV